MPGTRSIIFRRAIPLDICVAEDQSAEFSIIDRSFDFLHCRKKTRLKNYSQFHSGVSARVDQSIRSSEIDLDRFFNQDMFPRPRGTNPQFSVCTVGCTNTDNLQPRARKSV